MLFTLMLFNCSTVKVVNNQQEDNVPSLTNKDVLAVTKADDHVVRVRFKAFAKHELNRRIEYKRIKQD